VNVFNYTLPQDNLLLTAFLKSFGGPPGAFKEKLGGFFNQQG